MLNLTGNPSEDRIIASHWAWRQLQNPDTLLLDTETSGLDGSAEICQIAVMNLRGDVLLDTLVKPRRPIPAAAEAIHGISMKTVQDAPSFEHAAVTLRQILSGHTCLIYNRDYDTRLIQQSALAADIDGKAIVDGVKFDCVMLAYAAWVGERGRYGDYRWQRLPSGDHSALGDCIATRRLLYEMAGLAWMLG